MARNKERLDRLLVHRELAPTLAKAQALIMAGAVRVTGQVATTAGQMVPLDAVLHVREQLPYVGRGGLKLAHALDEFHLDPQGLVALDTGACTGGFTDVLLQRGANRVYAVDVGYGLLDWKIRQDPRVIVLERTNIRHLDALHISPNHTEVANCGVVDVSFISLGVVLPAMLRLLTPEAWIVALIKPQFEAAPDQVGKGGIVRDTTVHQAVLENVVAKAEQLGLATRGLIRSPITGAEGNIEFLAHFAPHTGSSISTSAIAALAAGE